MIEERFDPNLYAALVVDLCGSGELALGRLMSAWDLIATAAGLRPLWPAALALAELVAITRPIPTGAADVFAWLRRYAHEVPGVTLPDVVVVMASERGSTKAHHEARALQATVERGATR